MIKVNNLLENDLINITIESGCFKVLEYERDMSIHPACAETAFFCSEMDIRKRQLYCDLSRTKAGVVLEAGAMQYMIGNVSAKTDVKGVGDLIKKGFRGKVTGESAIKPLYHGNGILVTEPTYMHLLLTNPRDWGGQIVIQDGMFAACEANLEQKMVARKTLSGAALGNEGLFNFSLKGDGLCVLESFCPKEEIVEILLDNDVLKIDGNQAIAWSEGLTLTVERTTKSLVGSAASGEGFVNTYRGTGRVWMLPLEASTKIGL